MVKYKHCEKCKSIYNTESWIGEVHVYTGICPSCMAGEQQENQMQQKNAVDPYINKNITEETERLKDIHEHTQTSPIEIEKDLLSGLGQKANDVLFGEGSINVLIKEIKDGLIDKAKKRIGETFQSFDVNKIDAQKVVNYAENILDYLNEYKNYMDNVIKKLQDNRKMKVKTAIGKVFKESMVNMPKDVAKDVLLNKKARLKIVSEKAVKWYNIYSDTRDVFELTKQMGLHPFKEIQKKLSTLPFYPSS
ncbi:MAG: hypothetical protein Lokiarch_31280 [Candidatus Lokiarchaeum sp. GC14_75]|nr:MAG: hypothetical protein Lokiarch_31280 [Candidatus Lokiarchaeum sp. GC14_75]